MWVCVLRILRIAGRADAGGDQVVAEQVAVARRGQTGIALAAVRPDQFHELVLMLVEPSCIDVEAEEAEGRVAEVVRAEGLAGRRRARGDGVIVGKDRPRRGG